MAKANRPGLNERVAMSRKAKRDALFYHLDRFTDLAGELLPAMRPGGDNAQPAQVSDAILVSRTPTGSQKLEMEPEVDCEEYELLSGITEPGHLDDLYRDERLFVRKKPQPQTKGTETNGSP